MKLICPYCFKEIKKEDIKFYCKTCKGKNGKPKQVNGIYTDENKEEKRIYGKINRNNYCICDECGQATNDMKCPECKNKLPTTFFDAQTKVMAVVGNKHSGKSYFVGTLLKQLRYGNVLKGYSDISVSWEDRQSEDTYKEKYSNQFDTGNKLRGTNNYNISTTFGDNDYNNKPIILRLGKSERSFFHKDGVTNYYRYSFIDFAGEQFANENPENIDNIRPYLINAEAILFILDPDHLDIIRERFNSHTSREDCDWHPIVDTTNNILRLAKNVGTKSKIKIPVCVCISKWDMLLSTGLVPDNLLISSLENMSGAYNENMVKTISEELRSLLIDFDSNLIKGIEEKFSDVTYVAFSAWGSPQEGPTIRLVPYRVEDPFMWVLHKKKLL